MTDSCDPQPTAQPTVLLGHCVDCAFYLEEHGQCRIRSTQLVAYEWLGDANGTVFHKEPFPLRKLADWCGEFTPRELAVWWEPETDGGGDEL